MFGIRLKGQATTCNRARVCPNCFARLVVFPTWTAFGLALTVIRATRGDAAFENIQVLGIRWERSSKSDDWNQWLTACKTKRRGLIDEVSAQTTVYGAITHFNLVSTSKPDYINAVRYGVMIVKKPGTPVTVQDGVVKSAVATDNKARASLFSWALQYPLGLLRGDPGRCAWLLTHLAESKVKLSMYEGLCDNANMREALRQIERPVRV